MSSDQGPLYYAAPPALEEATRPNLEQTLAQLGLHDKDVLSVTDPQWPFALQIELAFS